MKRSKHRWSFTSPNSGTLRAHFTRQGGQPGTPRCCARGGTGGARRRQEISARPAGLPPRARARPASGARTVWSGGDPQKETRNLPTTHPLPDLRGLNRRSETTASKSRGELVKHAGPGPAPSRLGLRGESPGLYHGPQGMPRPADTGRHCSHASPS